MTRETAMRTGTLRSLKAVVMKQPKVSAAMTLREKAKSELARDNTVFISPPGPAAQPRRPRPLGPSLPQPLGRTPPATGAGGGGFLRGQEQLQPPPPCVSPRHQQRGEAGPDAPEPAQPVGRSRATRASALPGRRDIRLPLTRPPLRVPATDSAPRCPPPPGGPGLAPTLQLHAMLCFHSPALEL